MKKLNLLLTAILFAISMFSCNDSDLTTNPAQEDETLSNPKGGNITVDPNPAIVWRTNETINKTSVDALWVMDADGSNKTRLYMPSTTTGRKKIRGLFSPHWSPNGSSICFAQQAEPGNYKSLYKLNVTISNGVPTATNVTKLYDATSNNAEVYDSYWSFGTTNEIIFIARKTTDNYYRIYAISGNGGTPATIYTGASGTTLRWVTVSPDGSQIAFSETVSGGSRYLKVINRSDGSEVYSIQTNSILGGSFTMDWARTSGSTTLALYGTPVGSSTATVYTIDVTNDNSLTSVKSGARAPSWSPDDSKIVYTEIGTTNYIKTVRLSDGATTSLGSNLFGYEMHWKK